MFDRFSDRSIECILRAQEEARMMQHRAVKPEHLLLGLIAAGHLKIDLEEARGLAWPSSEIEKKMPAKLDLSPESQAVFDAALEESRSSGHRLAEPGHILIALASSSSRFTGQILEKTGKNATVIKEETREKHSSQKKEKLKPPAKMLYSDRIRVITGAMSVHLSGRSDDVLASNLARLIQLIGDSADAPGSLVYLRTTDKDKPRHIQWRRSGAKFKFSRSTQTGYDLLYTRVPLILSLSSGEPYRSEMASMGYSHMRCVPVIYRDCLLGGLALLYDRDPGPWSREEMAWLSESADLIGVYLARPISSEDVEADSRSPERGIDLPFSLRCGHLITIAGKEMRAFGHRDIHAEHILIALAGTKNGPGELLDRLLIDRAGLRERVSAGTFSPIEPLIDTAGNEAIRLGFKEIYPEHFVLSLLKCRNKLLLELLAEADMKADSLTMEMERILSRYQVT
ncbi:MAG: Clp protease N-terminal domain-containing protein [Candidatus Obscuribacterales bacterium]